MACTRLNISSTSRWSAISSSITFPPCPTSASIACSGWADPARSDRFPATPPAARPYNTSHPHGGIRPAKPQRSRDSTVADWKAHLSLIRDTAAPLPEPLAALLVQLTEQLTTTTADTPLAALRAVGMLGRIAARVGREAAGALADDGVSAETVAVGLGTTRSKALMLLLTAQSR
ncbi:hypothetical protein [Streptomyces sp. A0592]|uniref:hypothetical protein n=1 Tax=Streptomyces sp. A0592 TaxID=2563099 RepID=UPI0014461D8D|nr:hypothetical protein [Streptomyces sp. A0592]